MVIDTAILAAIDALARHQAGHVGRWQLLGLGCTPAQVDRLACQMGWTRIHAGTWRLPGVSPSAEGDLWAAVLAAMSAQQRGVSPDGQQRVAWERLHERACRSVAAGGFSAAWLYGMVHNPPSVPQLLLPHDLQRRRRNIRTLRTRVWRDTITMVSGVPATDPVRTLWDCSWVIRHEPGAIGRIRRMMTRADGLRLCQAPDLHMFAREPREYGLPGVVPEPFRAAAFSLAGGHSHSGVEHRGRQIISEVAAEMGLAVEPRPFPVHNDNGVQVAEADVAIPLIHLDCEIDGPHHDEPEQQRKDRWRDSQMRRLGWTVRRYRAELVDEDEAAFRELVAADIRQAAAQAGIDLLAA